MTIHNTTWHSIVMTFIHGEEVLLNCSHLILFLIGAIQTSLMRLEAPHN